MRFPFRDKDKKLNERAKQIITALVWESLMTYTKPYDAKMPENTRN